MNPANLRTPGALALGVCQWELFYYLIKITHYRKADMPLYDNLGLDISTHHQMSKQAGRPQCFPVCLPKPLLPELL